MYFLDFYGPANIYHEVREPLKQELAGIFKAAPGSVHIRRVLTEDERSDVELWVELSSEEQLIRFGRELAGRLSAAVRQGATVDVWVMFRIVPLSQAFLNGLPRGRSRPWSD